MSSSKKNKPAWEKDLGRPPADKMTRPGKTKAGQQIVVKKQRRV